MLGRFPIPAGMPDAMIDIDDPAHHDPGQLIVRQADGFFCGIVTALLRIGESPTGKQRYQLAGEKAEETLDAPPTARLAR